MSLRVACLGPEGTVSQEALQSASLSAGIAVEALLTPSIHAAVAAVRSDEADFALVPIENSLEGGVAATLDELLASGGMTPIVGELLHPVRHRLIARSDMPLDQIEGLVSLPFVADQCSVFLQEHLPGIPITPASSTADAVRTIADSQLPLAALGTELAARIYGCTVIEPTMNPGGNTTRFVWLAPSADGDTPPGVRGDAPRRTSIVFWGAGTNEPGWLVECLAEFGSRSVNLTRIESRPRREGLGSYVFFADVEGSADDSRVEDALHALSARTEEVRMLGSYPTASVANL